MSFIQKNKIKIFIFFIIFFVIIFTYIKIEQRKYFLSIFYPPIDEKISLKLEYEKIEDKKSTQLFVYFFHRNNKHEENLSKSKYWNQICLFYKSDACINLSYFWSLEENDDNIRRKYFISNNYIEDVNWSQCKKYYYLLQSKQNLKNKEIFFNNYNDCKIEYYQYLPQLKNSNYENFFLIMLKELK